MWFPVIAIVLSGPHHKSKTLEYSLFYPTQYTCDIAETRIDRDAVRSAAAAKHRKKKIISVTAECTEFKVPDPDNRCEWQLACSTRINQI